ncbi:MAG: ribosome biogenesis GTPase Der [Alphaproteobacteria bacterium]|jgi:GTP-binding protein|nr:ribosome biogenesis GTPase Der [Alphaproteobacteria bacterium]
MSFTVAIIGRPNVGKSTLFNRLIGKRLALVDDTPGVTRDRRAAPARLGPLTFTVIDTAGLEEAFDDSLEARMRRQTEVALAEADVALFMIDARAGITPLDRHFAGWLRQSATPVILVANKAEGRAGQAGLYEAFELGLDAPVPISAEHGEGMADLVEALLPFEAAAEAAAAAAAPDGETPAGEGDDADEPRVIQMAIVGRPNVGKSTLVNALIGEDRVLTGPDPGVTRDAIAVEWQWDGRPIRLVDTAGMRRKARITDKVERIAVQDTLGAVRLAQVVVLVVEADAVLDRQDLTIAAHVIEEGRALVVAVNKWDAASDRRATLRRLNDRLETSLTQVRGIPTVTVSGLKRQGLDKLMGAVGRAYDTWNTRISTGPLNRWLAAAVESHPPPVVKGRRLKLRYMTQVKARPPTFAVFTTRPEDVPESYLRYLVNGLRERFSMAGTPIRIVLRKGKNPFADKA